MLEIWVTVLKARFQRMQLSLSGPSLVFFLRNEKNLASYKSYKMFMYSDTHTPKLKLLCMLVSEYILVALLRKNHVLLMALHLQMSLQIHLFTYFLKGQLFITEAVHF